MRKTRNSRFIYSLFLGLVVMAAVVAASTAARADDEGVIEVPRSVSEFVEHRKDYSFSNMCTIASGRMGYVLFHKNGTLNEALLIRVTPTAAMPPERVIEEQSSFVAAATGSVKGENMQTITVLPAVDYKLTSGAKITVVQRDTDKLVDHSSMTAPAGVEMPAKGLRCSTKFGSFKHLVTMATDYRQTKPRENTVADSPEAKKANLEDHLWRVVGGGTVPEAGSRETN